MIPKEEVLLEALEEYIAKYNVRYISSDPMLAKQEEKVRTAVKLKSEIYDKPKPAPYYATGL